MKKNSRVEKVGVVGLFVFAYGVMALLLAFNANAGKILAENPKLAQAREQVIYTADNFNVARLYLNMYTTIDPNDYPDLYGCLK